MNRKFERLSSMCVAFRPALVIMLAISFASSTAAITQAANSDADRSKRLIRQADKMYRQANYGEAEKILRNLVVSDPTNTLAKLKLAQVRLKQRFIVEAYDLAYPVAVADPENPYALAVIGSVLIAAGRLKDARPILYKAIDLNKREALAWAGLGLLEFYENRINEAVLNLREAVLYEPNHADFTFALAQVSARAENYKDAAASYQRFLELSKDTDDERRARIRGLIAFLRFLGSRDGLYQTSGSPNASIPFELAGNRPVLRLRMNGHREPLNFILDTGSGISVLSNETAARLKIKPITRGGYAKGIGGNGKFEIVYGFIKQLEIGDVRVRNIPVYIRQFHTTGMRVDGYIGLSVISKFITTVDYGDLKFSLERYTEASSQDIDETRALPLRLTSSGFLSGEVTLDGIDKPVNFIVDTGASISVISNELASIKSINLTEMPQRLRVIGAAGITEDVRSFLLPKISFGDNSRSAIAAVALNLDLINEASGFEQGGILGGNFLKSYKLTFDFRNARVLFDPIKDKSDSQSVPLE